MKNLLILLITFPFLKLSAQNSSFQFNCDDFNFNIESNTRNSLEFINEYGYFSKLKDTITKPKKPLIIENKELDLEFQKKFPNKITEHCVHAKNFSRGEVGETSYCSEKQKIFLINKEYNFYIFKLNAFEIDDYILFNTEDETIYFTENYPLILDNGKIIYDIGYSYGGSHIINYKFGDNKKVDYLELNIPYGYRIKNYNITNFQKTKLIVELIRYDLKETSPNHYEHDKTVFCKKFLLIN